MKSNNPKINHLFNIIDTNPDIANKEAILLYKSEFSKLSNMHKSEIIYIISATFWILGDNSNAMNFARKNIANAYSIIGMINSYKILGNITADLKNYSDAIDYYNNGLQLAIDNNLINEYYAFYNNIGNVYSDINAYKNAIKYFLKSIKCHYSNKINIGLAEMNLVEAYISINDLNSALLYLNKANDLLKSNPSNIGIANLNTVYAKYYFANDEYKKSYDCCKLSIDNYNDANNEYRNMNNYIIMSDIYLIENDYEDTIFYLEKAYNTANNFDDYIQVANLSSKLATLYNKQNNLEKALFYYKAFTNSIIKNSALNNKHIKSQIETKEKIQKIELERKYILKENIELTKINNKIELINNIGKEITSTLDFKHAAYKINSILKNVLKIDFLIIAHINKDRKSMKYIEISNIDNTKIRLVNENSSLEDTLAQWIINNKKPIFSNNYREEYKKYKTNFKETLENSPDSIIFIPLKSNNKIIGFFSIQSLLKNAYTNDNFDFINTLSPFISTALENSIKSYQLIKEIEHSKKTKIKLEKANKQLEIFSNYDALTNIPNRRYLFTHLKKVTNLSFREKTPLTLLIIDIDYFKQYNDNYGHIKGDHCLRKLSEILTTSLKRKSDFVARYGGDEFVVILPNTDRDGAISIINEIISYLKEKNLEHKYSTASNRITLSIGGYSISGHNRITPRNFIKKADECLYIVKEKGGNGYHVITESQNNKNK